MSIITPYDVVEIIRWVLLSILLPCALVYAAWFALTRFSRKIPIVLDFLRCFCFIVVLLLVLRSSLLHTLLFWPPHWLERIRQRRIVVERVQKAGGMEAIRKDCEAIVQTNGLGFAWIGNFNGVEPALPESLSVLQPRMVQLWPEENGMESVRIQIFGGHATGGRGEDFYFLNVICRPPPNFQSPFQVNPNAKVQYGNRRLADGIYESTGGS